MPDTGVEVSAAMETVPDMTNPPDSFEYGLFVRGDNNGEGLTFTIDRHSGYTLWHVFQRTGGANTRDVRNEYNRPTEPVKLTIRAVGDDFAFYINDEMVTHQHILGLSGTSLGIYLASNDSSKKSHIHFSNFEIRKVNANDPHKPHEFCS